MKSNCVDCSSSPQSEPPGGLARRFLESRSSNSLRSSANKSYAAAHKEALQDRWWKASMLSRRLWLIVSHTKVSTFDTQNIRCRIRERDQILVDKTKSLVRVWARAGMPESEQQLFLASGLTLLSNQDYTKHDRPCLYILYICTHAHMYVSNMYMYVYIYTYIHKFMYIYMYIRIYIYIHTYMYTYVYICIHMYIYTYIYIYVIFTYTYILSGADLPHAAKVARVKVALDSTLTSLVTLQASNTWHRALLTWHETRTK